MPKSRIEISYRFSQPVEDTTGHDGVTRYYNCYVAPEDLDAFHQDVKVIAVKYGAVKDGKEKKE